MVLTHIAAHIIIRGYVQGVGFRYFAYHGAASLGLTGYVRNTHDGGVELEVEGARSLIEELIKGLKVGPRLSFQNRFDSFRIEH
jgi:acylphosphatase